MSYGTDLAVQIDARTTIQTGRYVRVTASGGVMVAEVRGSHAVDLPDPERGRHARGP